MYALFDGWWQRRRRRRKARATIVRVNRSELSIDVGGKVATVDGEMLVRERGAPDFVVYGATSWDDGTPVTAADLDRIRAAIEELAASGALALEIDGPLREREMRPA
ncbi:MAG: Immunity protein 74 [Gaiellaceae bacterium]|nr:Immunity protein 74 [Gaiellaceae bacterium]